MLQKYIALMLTILVAMIGYGFYWVHQGGIDTAVYGGLLIKETNDVIADSRADTARLKAKGLIP